MTDGKKKVGITFEPWKLDVFKKHLDGSKFKGDYEVAPGETVTVITVFVPGFQVVELTQVIKAAVLECKKKQMH